jgi:hypothetical protein
MQLYFLGHITELHQLLTPSNREKWCENSKNRASGDRCNLQSCSAAPKPTTPQVQRVGASSHYMVQNSSLSVCQNLLLYRYCHPYYPYSYRIVDCHTLKCRITFTGIYCFHGNEDSHYILSGLSYVAVSITGYQYSTEGPLDP